jgi:hypothetical protein
MNELANDTGSICSQCYNELSQAEAFREKCLQALHEVESKITSVVYELVDEYNPVGDVIKTDESVVIKIQMVTEAEPIRRSRRKMPSNDLKIQRGSKT